MSKKSFSAIVLAAGKGTRMKSAFAKVSHNVFFKPMIYHVLDALLPLQANQIVVVTGHQAETVERLCSDYNVRFARQTEQLGTGHAVLAAQNSFDDINSDVIMILCGDTPLIQTETLKSMLDNHISEGHILSVMTAVAENPTNYGRILLDDTGCLQAIVEEKDATSEQKKINEINAGIYCIDKKFLFSALKNLKTDNKQGELYFTDIVAIANSQGFPVNRFCCLNIEETLGVNSRMELASAHQILQKRFIYKLMESGVTCILPETLSISGDTVIGRDTVISPNVFIGGKCVIGDNCLISSFSCLLNSRIGDNVIVHEHSYLNGAEVESNSTLSPGTHINNSISCTEGD